MADMTLEEALAAATVDEELVTPVNEVLMINPETRTINVPDSEKLFGARQDMGVERKYFKCPRIVGDNIDLSEHRIFVNYVPSKQDGTYNLEDDVQGYWCKDLAVEGDFITFSWEISENVTRSAGYIAFAVYAKTIDEYGNLKTKWHTTIAIGNVLDTLSDGEEWITVYPDIVMQLLERMDEVEKIATEEAMQGYVDDYFNRNPMMLDRELKDETKAAPADIVGKLSEENNDIVSIIKAIFRSAGYNVLSFDFVEGTIDSATGDVGVNKNNVITDFISSNSFTDEIVYISVQEGYQLYVYHYNSEKEYTGIVINRLTTESLLIPESGYYKFMFSRIDGSKASVNTASLCAVSGIKVGTILKELNKIRTMTVPSFLLNTKNKVDAKLVFPMLTDTQINGSTGVEFINTKGIMVSDFIPVKESDGNQILDSVEFYFYDPTPGGNAAMFFYDKNKSYSGQYIATEGVTNYTYDLTSKQDVYFVRLEYRLDILPNMKIYLNSSSNIYEWLKIKKNQVIDDAKIDVGENYYLIKDEPLELFRHGMVRKKYGNYVKPEGEYLISLNNNPGYNSDYVSKLTFNVPESVSGDMLGTYEPWTSAPALRIYDLDMKSLDYQYINIYMTAKSDVVNKIRNLCFFGDSLTAMGYITKHIKDKLIEYGLTDTKLVGVNSNLDDEENRFTATGGYSWSNYTENPSTLPSDLGNNYLWNPNKNDIDFEYFMQNYGDSGTMDYAIVLLGWNDYDMRNAKWPDYATEGIAAIERKARKFITTLNSQYPNCKILLSGYHVSTTMERNMHPNLPYESRNKFVWELNDLYKKLETEFPYVYFIHTASQFDSYNNMRKTEAKPNIYAENTVTMITDDVHPAVGGYYQYGDADLRCLMYLMKNES